MFRETGGTAPSRNSQGDREDKIIGPNFEPPDPEMWRLYNNSFPQPQIPGSLHNPPLTGPSTSFKPFAITELGQSDFIRAERGGISWSKNGENPKNVGEKVIFQTLSFQKEYRINIL